MKGKWTWNLVLGLTVMVLTFLFSVANNLLTTSLIRSVYAFACAFLLGFILQFLWEAAAGYQQKGARPNETEGVGTHIDFSTPAEDGLPVPPKPEGAHNGATGQTGDREQTGEEEFKPLTFKPLDASSETDPGKVAKVIRHLSREN